MAIINLSSQDLFVEIGVASAALKDDGKLATAHCVSEDLQMGRGIAINFK